jgi:fructoselysine-6-P-deglycase FrlB-like protein
MLNIERELASQPFIWRRAGEVAASAGSELPEQGQRVAIIGCGTSYFVGQSMATLREASDQGETDAFAASEAPVGRAYDAVLAVSRSGTTTEVLIALERATADATTIAISARGDSPIAACAHRTVTLAFADERSVVQTRFATAALALWRAHLDEPIEPLSAAAEEALTARLPDLEKFNHYVFLGTGWGTGLANEAALKLREAAGAWTESHPVMEYRHGPISAVTSRTLVWAVGPVDEAVLGDAAEAGGTVINSRRDPMAELVVIQRAAVALAKARGLDPDEPRHLSRSVVLQATPQAVGDT